MLGACSFVVLYLDLLPSLMDPCVWFCTSAMSFLLLIQLEISLVMPSHPLVVCLFRSFCNHLTLRLLLLLLLSKQNSMEVLTRNALNLHRAVCKMVIFHGIKSSSWWAWKDIHMSSPLSFFPVVLKFSFQWSHSYLLRFNLVCYFFMLSWMGMFLWFFSWSAFHWCVEWVLFFVC